MKNLFKWSPTSPFHISVGVLLTNDKGEICAHHYRWGDEGERYLAGMGSAREYYLLMRESIEDGETIEQVIERGLMEEFGATGTIERYIGSIQSTFPIDDLTVEKTTVYFHVACTSFDEKKRDHDDDESKSTIEWIAPEVLLERMETLGALMERTDRDESKIVKAYMALKG